VSQLGGRFRAHSDPKGGTRLTAAIPLAAA
jgi:signal transduction histidine kinase